MKRFAVSLGVAIALTVLMSSTLVAQQPPGGDRNNGAICAAIDGLDPGFIKDTLAAVFQCGA